MKSKVKIVIYTHSEYSFVWKPFIEQMNKFAELVDPKNLIKDHGSNSLNDLPPFILLGMGAYLSSNKTNDVNFNNNRLYYTFINVVKKLIFSSTVVFDYCIKNGFNFTDREHINIFKNEAKKR